MIKYEHNSRSDSMLRALSTMICIGVNVGLSFAACGLGLPVFLDTLGTVTAAALGGLFPAVMAAIFTNIICSLFNSHAIYFSLINALVAIFSSWFVREKSFRNVKNIFLFVMINALIGGGLGGVFQWMLFGEPQSEQITALLNYAGFSSGVLNILFFLVINIFINIIEYLIFLGIMQFVLHYVPENVKTRIKNSTWRQKPLSLDEVNNLNLLNKNIRFSIKKRILMTLLAATLTLTVVMGWIGISLYYGNAKQDRTENAMSTAEAAAGLIDPDKIEQYIANGWEAEGYSETADMLEKIQKSSYEVEYLYVITVSKEYVTFVFDVETGNGEQAYEPGDKVDIEDDFKPYLPALLNGEKIEPVDNKGIWKWMRTIYYPVYNDNGNCVCYVGADVSLNYLADYMKDFMFRVVLIVSGFFVLILAFGLLVTGVYMVYPIDKLVEGVEDFVSAGADQALLDEKVRKLRAIDIHTGDEVEKLYNAICEMASSQTEQLRSIRHLAENTSHMQDGLIITMADLVENRDSDTGAHIQKTAAYVKIIVEGLKKKGYYAEKITPQFMSDVVRSAPLHDVGKINIPDYVLNKPGKLTDEEYEIMKTHTTAGRKIMEKAINTVGGENYLKEARNMAAYHHERWDGMGYPEGLHGEVIPLSARIMAVADVFDALTSPRVYKPAFKLDEAVEMIREGAGSQFDEKCVEVFLDALPEVKVILRKYNAGA